MPFVKESFGFRIGQATGPEWEGHEHEGKFWAGPAADGNHYLRTNGDVCLGVTGCGSPDGWFDSVEQIERLLAAPELGLSRGGYAKQRNELLVLAHRWHTNASEGLNVLASATLDEIIEHVATMRP